MSTALQRLLAKPSSLAFLRYLAQTPSLDHALQRANHAHCTCTGPFRRRRYVTKTAGSLPVQQSSLKAVANDTINDELHSQSSDKHVLFEPQISPEFRDKQLSAPILDERYAGKAWGVYLRNFEDVELESNLNLRGSHHKKLVDDPQFSKDFMLWNYLLNFRKRRYGNAGVAMFWTSIRDRGLELPTEGSIADELWSTFLKAGFEDRSLLHDILKYADDLYDSSGNHWPKLYVYIIQHMIQEEGRQTTLEWHKRLIQRHPPGPTMFSKLVRNIVWLGGDLQSLQSLYKTPFFETHKSYKTYAKIVPVLLGRKDFHIANHWHFFLVKRGDCPPNEEVVKPMIDHFTRYDPAKAKKIKASLTPATSLFLGDISSGSENSEVISRETMNLVHGEAFGIKPKKYSDRLGARWFATSWISLDLAVNALYAIGVREIGPLSLQAIALREVDPSAVIYRIEKLKQLGISIGNSVFSRAVESFAKNGETEYLQGLLRSDQHPDSFEDPQIQNILLSQFARAEDWANYRLLAAIRIVGSSISQVEQFNMIQQANILTGDRPTIFKMLEEMRLQRIPASQNTVRSIMEHFLPNRRKRQAPFKKRAPLPGPESLEDLQTAISILTTMTKFGSFVPASSWHELIRRLGMLGRLDDLEKLCLWLAIWYNRSSNLRSSSIQHLSALLPLPNSFMAPAQVPTSHARHPLRMLFPNSLQQAIVEWGFIHQRPRQPCQSTAALPKSGSIENYEEPSTYHYTRGVRLLRQLQDNGVYIDIAQIRRALQTRFAILYNPGKSRVVRNELLRQQNCFTRSEMVANLNEVWGADIYLDKSDSRKDSEKS